MPGAYRNSRASKSGHGNDCARSPAVRLYLRAPQEPRDRRPARDLRPRARGESRNMETKGMKGAEAFLRVLASMGVERIFASPGSEWAPVWEFLDKPYDSPRDIPQYLSTRHEEVAVGMASGY